MQRSACFNLRKPLNSSKVSWLALSPSTPSTWGATSGGRLLSKPILTSQALESSRLASKDSSEQSSSALCSSLQMTDIYARMILTRAVQRVSWLVISVQKSSMKRPQPASSFSMSSQPFEVWQSSTMGMCGWASLSPMRWMREKLRSLDRNIDSQLSSILPLNCFELQTSCASITSFSWSRMCCHFSRCRSSNACRLHSASRVPLQKSCGSPSFLLRMSSTCCLSRVCFLQTSLKVLALSANSSIISSKQKCHCSMAFIRSLRALTILSSRARWLVKYLRLDSAASLTFFCCSVTRSRMACSTTSSDFLAAGPPMGTRGPAAMTVCLFIKYAQQWMYSTQFKITSSPGPSSLSTSKPPSPISSRFLSSVTSREQQFWTITTFTLLLKLRLLVRVNSTLQRSEIRVLLTISRQESVTTLRPYIQKDWPTCSLMSSPLAVWLILSSPTNSYSFWWSCFIILTTPPGRMLSSFLNFTQWFANCLSVLEEQYHWPAFMLILNSCSYQYLVDGRNENYLRLSVFTDIECFSSQMYTDPSTSAWGAAFYSIASSAIMAPYISYATGSQLETVFWYPVTSLVLSSTRFFPQQFQMRTHPSSRREVQLTSLAVYFMLQLREFVLQLRENSPASFVLALTSTSRVGVTIRLPGRGTTVILLSEREMIFPACSKKRELPSNPTNFPLTLLPFSSVTYTSRPMLCDITFWRLTVGVLYSWLTTSTPGFRLSRRMVFMSMREGRSGHWKVCRPGASYALQLSVRQPQFSQRVSLPWKDCTRASPNARIAIINEAGGRTALTIRDSIVVSIPACHAGSPGSIPGRGVFSLYIPKDHHPELAVHQPLPPLHCHPVLLGQLRPVSVHEQSLHLQC